MSVRSILAVTFLAFAVALSSASDDKPAKPRRPKFTIGKDTTYVAGPVDKDGYIDYEAALNDRLKAGVTPDKNACVLLWQVLGPHPEGVTMPAEFFERLGAPAPPEKGHYFIDLNTYLKDQVKIATSEERLEMSRAQEQLAERPWTADKSPHLAGWLQANQKPLDLLHEAVRRPQYYYPVVSRKGGLLASLLPGVQKCRTLANALRARAMLHIGERRYDAAWADLLACHRLARLVARGGTLIEGLVGMAIERFASTADLALLNDPGVDMKRLKTWLHDLQELPPLLPIADKVDLAERFVILETLMILDRHGIKYLEMVSGGSGVGLHPLADGVLEDTDWDPALRNANRLYDRLAAAMRIKDRAGRTKQLAQIQDDVVSLKNKLTKEGGMADLLGTAEAKGRVMGDLVIALLMPAAMKVQIAADRVEQTQRNLQLAFALAIYQRQHGKYPEQLAALTPMYLPQAPLDLFAGGPLVYRPAANGYLLYRIGPNGRDEQGRNTEDEPPGDDLRVQMPLPPLKRP